MKKIRVFLGILCVLSVSGCVFYIRAMNTKKDVDPPEMAAIKKEISVSISATEKELIEGISARDAVDGDVTSSILIESIQKTEESDHSFLITYASFDSSNNYAMLEQKLNYTDYTKPHFQISEQLRFPENQPVPLFTKIQAVDCIDGDLTPFITLEGGEDLMESPSKGIYDCKVSVTNSVGDTAVLPFEVEVYEDSYEERNYCPEIFLTGYLVYLKQGESFDPADYIDHIEDQGFYRVDPAILKETVGENGEITAPVREKDTIYLSDIDIRNTVDTETPGVYDVNYKYKSMKSEYGCSVKLIVVVE